MGLIARLRRWLSRRRYTPQWGFAESYGDSEAAFTSWDERCSMCGCYADDCGCVEEEGSP